MKISTVVIFAAVALLGECAKLPKDSKPIKTAAKVATKAAKALPPKLNAAQNTKHKHVAPGKTVAPKHDSNKAGPSTTTHVTAKTTPIAKNISKTVKVTPKKNRKSSFWSPKSVILPHKDTGVQNAIVNSHIASNPMLDKLYEERYQAMEKVSAINDQINSLLSRKPVMDGGSESSYLRPGAFDSGTYHVQGGTMFLGPANAGDIVGMEVARKRDESSTGRQKDGAIPETSSASPFDSSKNDSSALADMPQPLDDQFFSAEANGAENEQKNLTAGNDMDLLADMDDPLVLGDPKMFDSACSVMKLTFEHTQGAMVLDDSPQDNNAELQNGAFVSDQQAKSGLSATIGEDGYMDIPGEFKGKPTKAAAVSLWAKIQSVDGNNPLFQTYDHLQNSTGLHYDLSVVDGRLSWGHRDDLGKALFHVTANDDAKFTSGKWHHVVGAYSGKAKKATLWLDGKEVGKEENVSGILSQNWDSVSLFKGKTAGVVDNVFMFRCSLDRTKVVALFVAAASPKDAKRYRIPKVKSN